MSDYIDRQAAKEVLNKVCGITCPTNHRNQRGLICGACVLGRAINIIDELPSADVVEVVWCKDCKYATLSIDETGGVCTNIGLCIYPHDYCSLGERKDA